MYTLSVDPQQPTLLLAGTGGGVYFSTDDGANWTKTGLAHYGILSLAVDPKTPGAVDAGGRMYSSGGVFLSIGGGANWGSVLLRGQKVTVVTVNPVTPTVIYAGTLSNGVYRTSDGGQNWNQVNTGLTNP